MLPVACIYINETMCSMCYIRRNNDKLVQKVVVYNYITQFLYTDIKEFEYAASSLYIHK